MCMFTETPEEPPPVEEGGLEGESWAKPLAHLWQSRPPNLKKEREYNQRVGSKLPYCSVCTLFHTYQQVNSQTTHCTDQQVPWKRILLMKYEITPIFIIIYDDVILVI